MLHAYSRRWLAIVLFLSWGVLSLTATAQISLVKKFDPCCAVGPFEALGNLVIFNAEDKLWVSDGTDAGTTLLTAGAKFDNYSFRRCRAGNVVYLQGHTADGAFNALWKTDGTAAGTTIVKVLPEGNFQSTMANVNGLLIFSYRTTAAGNELWRSDGTDAGTYMITDLAPGSGNGVVYDSPQSAVLAGYLYFQGPAVYTGDPQYGYQPTLYRTDGTAAGTTQVANSGYGPYAMNVINGRLIYQAYYPVTDTYGSPCFAQPTVVTQFPTVLMVVENGVASVLKYPANVPYCGKSVPGGNTFLNTRKFVKSDSYLYFTGQTENGAGGYNAVNLWRTDGTTNGTIQLTDFAIGSNEGPFGSMFTNGLGAWDYGFTDVAYFPIFTNAAGAELWRSDGTAAGTYLVKDINPGPNGSGTYAYNGTGNPNNSTGPLDFRVVNGSTYFFATEGVNGVELWKTNSSDNGTQLVQDLNLGTGSQPIVNSGQWDDNAFGISAGSTYYFYGQTSSDIYSKGLYAVFPAPVVTLAASTTATCPSQPVSLSASGCSNGTVSWSTGQTGAVVSVTPTATTVYSATCTVGQTSTPAQNSLTITVKPYVINAPAVAGTPVQAGQNVSVSFSTGPDCPFPNGTTYRADLVSPTSTTTSLGSVQPNVANPLTIPASTSAASGYSIRIVASNNVVSPASQPFTVTAPPSVTLTLAASTTLTCPSQPVSLSASGCGNGTVSWSTGQTGAVVSVTPTATTVYSATCTVGQTSTPAQNSLTVTVGQVQITQGPQNQSVCAGSPVSFSVVANGPGTLTYAWYKGTTTSAVLATTPVYTISSAQSTNAGTYIVKVSSTGCSSPQAQATLTVNPKPVAPTLTTASRQLCPSSNPVSLSQFVRTTNSTYTLRYYDPAGNRLSSPNVTLTQAGTYNYSATQVSQQGCEGPATTIALTVRPTTTLVSAPASRTVCKNQNTVLTVQATGSNLKYEWYKNGTAAGNKLTDNASQQTGTKTASLTVVKAQTSADYYVKVIGDCGTLTVGPARVTVNANCTGRLAAPEFVEVAALDVLVAPNPTPDGRLTVRIRGVQGQAVNLQVSDLRGRPLLSHSIDEATDDEGVEVDLSPQPTGLYLLRVSTPTESRTLKVIRQ